MSKQKKFTLIELLIVISVLLILATIVVPNVASTKKTALSAMMLQNIKAMQISSDMYYIENEAYATNKNPTWLEPTLINEEQLKTKYLKSLPNRKTLNPQYYWVDSGGTVWGSTVLPPANVLISENEIEFPAVKGAIGYRLYTLNSSVSGDSNAKKIRFIGDAPIQSESDIIKLKLGTPYENILISSIDSYGNETAPTGINHASNQNDWFSPITNKTGSFTFEITNKQLMYWKTYSSVVDKPEGTEIKFEFSVLKDGQYTDFTEDFNSLVPSEHIQAKITLSSTGAKKPSLYEFNIFYDIEQNELVEGKIIPNTTQNFENNQTFDPQKPTVYEEEFILASDKKPTNILFSGIKNGGSVQELEVYYKENNSYTKVNSYSQIPAGSIVKVVTVYSGGVLEYSPTVIETKKDPQMISPEISNVPHDYSSQPKKDHSSSSEEKPPVEEPTPTPEPIEWATVQTIAFSANSGDGQKTKWLSVKKEEVIPEFTQINYTYSYGISSSGQWLGEYANITEVPTSQKVRIMATLQVQKNKVGKVDEPQIISLSIISDKGEKPTHMIEQNGVEKPYPITVEIPTGWIGISTVEDLASIGKIVAYPRTGKYILMNNLDLNVSPYNAGKGWTAISNFAGTFDGNGLKIKNLYIKNTAINQGLFANTDNASISNLILEDVHIEGGSNVGSLIGTMGKLTNVYRVGVSNSYIKGTTYLGGLVGDLNWSATSDPMSIKESYIKGATIDGTSDNNGGLIGSMKTLGNNATVQNNYVFADVKGGKYIGGIAGWAESTNNMKYNYFVGTVPNRVSENQYRNAIFGWAQAYNSYFNKEYATESYYNSSLGRTTVDLQKKATFVGWDFTNMWTLDEGNDYPRLSWENR